LVLVDVTQRSPTITRLPAVRVEILARGTVITVLMLRDVAQASPAQVQLVPAIVAGAL